MDECCEELPLPLQLYMGWVSFRQFAATDPEIAKAATYSLRLVEGVGFVVTVTAIVGPDIHTTNYSLQGGVAIPMIDPSAEYVH